MAGTPEIARANGLKGGRPKGSYTKPRLRDYFTEEDIKELIASAKKKAMEGDKDMLKFILEQIYGKAPQSIDLNPEGKPLLITFDQTFNASPRKTEGSGA